MFTVTISEKHYNFNAFARLSLRIKIHDFLHRLPGERKKNTTGHILTFPIMHHFLSKQWQQTGTSNTVLLSSLIHDDVTHRFFDSEREAFPRF